MSFELVLPFESAVNIGIGTMIGIAVAVWALATGRV